MANPSNPSDRDGPDQSGSINPKELKQLLTLVLANQEKILALLDPSQAISSKQEEHLPKFDLSPLENHLEQGQWQQADQETGHLLLLACDRVDTGFLREDNFEQLPGSLLNQIDQLWVRASNGKFGFSVQRQLYTDLGGTKFFHGPVWEQFSQMVGWSAQGQWLSYEDLDFSSAAPKGHLPVMGDSQVWFVSRWQGCHQGFRSFIAHCRRHEI